VPSCDNIHLWISLSGDLAFSHQDGIYGFKFPKTVLEISSRDLTFLPTQPLELMPFLFAFPWLNAKQQSDILTVYQTQFFA
jgi:hypothetical protein